VNRGEVSACLISREIIDPQIMKSLEGFGEVIVGDGTHNVYGRYEAIKQAKFDTIYTQDDDCIVGIDGLLEAWDGHFTVNMDRGRLPEYPNNITLIGWGSIFKKELIGVLDQYTMKWGFDALFMRECDRVFTGLNTHTNYFGERTNLPNAYEGRMGNDPKHWEYLQQIKQRVEELWKA
jgi:hypothetical protein